MSADPKPSWGRRLAVWLGRLAKLGLLSLLLGALAGWLLLRKVERDLGDIHGLRDRYKPAQVTRVLARDGSVLAELFVERRTLVSIKDIPAHMKLAVLAAEDAGFYEHQGLNYLGMVRALVVNLRAGRTRQGGSTITQQVVKNILLDPERTYSRKLKEVVLARKIEQELTKDQILELYLNHIYWGGGRYGIEEASRYYFGKGVRDLTLAEAALLAGLPAGPEHFSPRHDLQKALARRAFVLSQMAEKGFVKPELAEAAKREAVRLAPVAEVQSSLAPEVVELVKRALRDAVGDGYARGGFTVHTTIDPRLQAAARRAVRDNLGALDKRTRAQAPFRAPLAPKGKARPTPLPPSERPFVGMPKAADARRALVGIVVGSSDADGTVDVKVGDLTGVVRLVDHLRYNPKALPASAFAEPGALVRVSLLSAPPEQPEPGYKPPLRLELGAEGALVALDAGSRDVLALVGSFEALSGGLDRATQSKRQPGSTFKPILYSYALGARRVTPATVFDLARAPGVRSGPDELPEAKPVRLREGVAKSLNPVAQRVLLDVGPQPVVRWAHELGISSKLGADLSLALGAYEVSPMEMAGAYATFAAGGVYETPRVITKIVAPDGGELPLPKRERRVVMDPAVAYLTTSVLGSVIDHGTGARGREVGRPVAGKTGTTNQAKDAWFIGYSPDVVCAVWTGYDDPRPLGGGREAGATAALPAWIQFMKAAHERKPAVDFPRPPGLSMVRIDPVSGLRAWEGQPDAIDELFLAGTEPVTFAEPDAGADGGAEDAAAPGDASPGDESRDEPREAPPPPAPPDAPAPDASTHPPIAPRTPTSATLPPPAASSVAASGR